MLPRDDFSVATEIYVNDEHLPVLIAESSLEKGALPALADQIINTLYVHQGLRLYCSMICPAACITVDNRSREGKAVSWKKFNAKIVTIASHLAKKGCNQGTHVLVLLPHGLEFVATE